MNPYCNTYRDCDSNQEEADDHGCYYPEFLAPFRPVRMELRTMERCRIFLTRYAPLLRFPRPCVTPTAALFITRLTHAFMTVHLACMELFIRDLLPKMNVGKRMGSHARMWVASLGQHVRQRPCPVNEIGEWHTTFLLPVFRLLGVGHVREHGYRWERFPNPVHRPRVRDP